MALQNPCLDLAGRIFQSGLSREEGWCVVLDEEDYQTADILSGMVAPCADHVSYCSIHLAQALHHILQDRRVRFLVPRGKRVQELESMVTIKTEDQARYFDYEGRRVYVL